MARTRRLRLQNWPRIFGVAGGEAAQGHAFGKGKVYSGKSIEDVLAAEQAGQDFSWTAPENVGRRHSVLSAGSGLRRRPALHSSSRRRPRHLLRLDAEASWLRCEGRVSRDRQDAALWHPESGEIEPVSYRTEQGQTVVPLHFDAQGSVFVVFEGSGAAPSRMHSRSRTHSSSLRSTVRGNLTFPPNLGAPAEADFPALASWTDKQRCRREVFLRHGYVSQAGGRAQGLVQARRQSYARSRHGQGLRRGRGQRQARRRYSLEASVSSLTLRALSSRAAMKSA